MPAPPPSRIHSRDFDQQVAGCQLRCRTLRPEGCEGPNSGPALVFLHEALGCISQWGRFPEELVRATGLPALLYDRYGHGASEALDGPRSPDYLEHESFTVLPQLLAALDIDAPVLVGHSDGGTIALLFAAEFPEVPRAVLCEAAHVFLEEITLQGLQRAEADFTGGPLRERLARHHGDRVDALFRGWQEVWRSPARRNWNVTARLASIQAPVLMIQGEDDEYGSPAQVQAVLSRVSGLGEAHLVPGCGHIPHSQARPLVLQRMTQFLAETKTTHRTSKP